jgi:hypothetical protein
MCCERTPTKTFARLAADFPHNPVCRSQLAQSPLKVAEMPPRQGKLAEAAKEMLAAEKL